ncbi:IS110 family transposase [Streptomyces sp. CA-106131]|uniref:IS110 family transposase n=1 Tax=Streptomyces sp. CA-106131 TaxID=3240045 RepID=UPI003D89FB3F
MDLLHERCAGGDLGKRDCAVCIRVPGKGSRRHQETKRFPTTTAGLLQLRDYLLDKRITVFGMEATGSYWKALYYLLEATDGIEPWLLNAQHIKNVPGRKTDVTDAQWICRLVENGLVRPSFVPPREIRQLRDLTRYRTETVQERSREINRLGNLLEDAGIKLTAVVSDIAGVSALRMLEAMVAGERDPEALADLAVGQLRKKHSELVQVLTGNFNEHHGFMVQILIRAIRDASARIALLEEEIARQIAPFRRQVELLITIPGISTLAAYSIIAEIGVDMSRFPGAEHLAAWSGLAPGNRESAGKRKYAPTRHGDVWLKGTLGMAALCNSRLKGTYLCAQFHHIRARRGDKRAIVAVAHSMIVSIYHMLSTDTPYQDLGPDHFSNRVSHETRRRRLLTQLDALGYEVTLTPRTEAA